MAGGRPDPRGRRLRPVRVPGLEVQRRPSPKPTGTGRAGSAAASMVRVRGAARTGAPPCEGRDGGAGVAVVGGTSASASGRTASSASRAVRTAASAGGRRCRHGPSGRCDAPRTSRTSARLAALPATRIAAPASIPAQGGRSTGATGRSARPRAGAASSRSRRGSGWASPMVRHRPWAIRAPARSRPGGRGPARAPRAGATSSIARPTARRVERRGERHHPARQPDPAGPGVALDAAAQGLDPGRPHAVERSAAGGRAVGAPGRDRHVFEVHDGRVPRDAPVGLAAPRVHRGEGRRVARPNTASARSGRASIPSAAARARARSKPPSRASAASPRPPRAAPAVALRRAALEARDGAGAAVATAGPPGAGVVTAHMPASPRSRSKRTTGTARSSRRAAREEDMEAETGTMPSTRWSRRFCIASPHVARRGRARGGPGLEAAALGGLGAAASSRQARTRPTTRLRPAITGRAGRRADGPASRAWRRRLRHRGLEVRPMADRLTRARLAIRTGAAWSQGIARPSAARPLRPGAASPAQRSAPRFRRRGGGTSKPARGPPPRPEAGARARRMTPPRPVETGVARAPP